MAAQRRKNALTENSRPEEKDERKEEIIVGDVAN
jgi:hypothetical protein